MSFSYGHDMPFGSAITSPVLDQAQTKLHQSEQSYSRTQQELQHLMRIRATTPMSQVETGRKDQEIAQLQEKLRQTEAEMRNLHDTIKRQQKTIKTQSEAISNPKQHYATPTPHRFGDSHHYGTMYGAHPGLPLAQPPPPPVFFNQGPPSQFGQPAPPPPPPSFDAQQMQGHNPGPFSARRSQQWSDPMMNHPQGPGMQPLPTPQRQPGNVTDFGSPEPLRPFNSASRHGTPFHSSRGSRETPISSARASHRDLPANAPPPAAPSFDANSMALVVGSEPRHQAPVIVKLKEVMEMAEKYAYAHVNVPSTQKDNQLPQEVKDILLKAASTTSAFTFMQTPFTRYYLVSKVMIQWMIKNILKHDCFAGFDMEVDRVIESCKNQIYQSTPAQVKYQLLSTIGEQMDKLGRNPHFQSFVSNIARTRGNELWGILKPMMHHKTSRDWDDLFHLMLETHDLARMMFSGSEEYKFDFPILGQPFRAAIMIPRDPYKNVKAVEELEAERVTVRLGITPIVTVRTSTAAGYVDSIMAQKANVFLNTTK